MNAKTFTETVNTVQAVTPVPKYKRQHEQATQQKRKIRKPFDSLFQTALKTENSESEAIPTGCYGKDAKPVVGNVCHFSAAM